MKIRIDSSRVTGIRDPMIYGHFIEHFHRQIYGGFFDPGNSLSDENGFRLDVIDALKKIKAPVMRWPGGCFVSAWHWKDAVGSTRIPSFDKAWRVEEPNTFGTDEFIAFCRKVGCAPYICTNAGSGSNEEMSDWVEYCNLKTEGQWAKLRIKNFAAKSGSAEPHNVKYWSIGNENYLGGEIGAKSAAEWGRLVCESSKMMKRVDPSIELSAAALADLDWNINLLRNAGDRLSWISIHQYWDGLWQNNNYADYEACMAFTNTLDNQVKKVRGLLLAMDLDKKIRISFDEWNLRGWHHPNVDKGLRPEEYLKPRDLNDENSRYTMADAVFSACFLNMANRNCDIIGMTNFAPAVNTRGMIFTHEKGLVLRPTYHVFDLYANELGETILDTFALGEKVLTVRDKEGKTAEISALDVLTTLDKQGNIVIAAVNKDPLQKQSICPEFLCGKKPSHFSMQTLEGKSPDSYNDIGKTEVFPSSTEKLLYQTGDEIFLNPHSVNIIKFS
jgi:alpha-N-arabinofuranosidase